MEPEFWHARWGQGRIGFHRQAVHPMLERYADRLPKGGRVLVPLCGKSLDLHYLAGRGHSVVGVELVEDAVTQFFAEANLTPTIERTQDYTVYRAGAIEIYVADIFDLTPQNLGRCDAVYDRAALVALPMEIRAKYAAHLAGLLPQEAAILMVTLAYPTGTRTGPPFSVPPSEVEAIFGGPFEVFQLASEMASEPQLHVPEGSLTEHGLWLRRRG